MGHPHGGYLLREVVRPLLTEQHPHPLTVSALFLRSPDPGASVVEVETLRSGRSVSQHRSRLVQHGRTVVEALVTTTALIDAEPLWSDRAPARPAAAGAVRTVLSRPDPGLPGRSPGLPGRPLAGGTGRQPRGRHRLLHHVGPDGRDRDDGARPLGPRRRPPPADDGPWRPGVGTDGRADRDGARGAGTGLVDRRAARPRCSRAAGWTRPARCGTAVAGWSARPASWRRLPPPLSRSLRPTLPSTDPGRAHDRAEFEAGQASPAQLCPVLTRAARTTGQSSNGAAGPLGAGEAAERPAGRQVRRTSRGARGGRASRRRGGRASG